MGFLSRREFLKLSSLALLGLYSEFRMPLYAGDKAFKPFKFAFVPDLHLSTQKFDNWILLNESLTILQDVIKTLNNTPLDFVLFGGDLIDNESKDLSQLNLLIDVLTQLEKPYYVIFGNREARLNDSLSKEDFTAEFRRYGFSERGRTYWRESPVEGLDLIGLDSSVINQTEGEISPDQLVWLSEILRENPNNLKIIAVHHPVMPTTRLDNFYKGQNFCLNNEDELMDLIDRTRTANIVLSAHHHLNLIATKNNIHYINSPSIVTYPCEFRLFDVNPDYIEVRNVPVSFKQMIKKAEEQLVRSNYAEQFAGIKPKELPKLHKGDNSSRNVKLII